jgi:hypothetical protein
MAWSSRGALACVGDCSWPSLVIVRGLVPSPVEGQKVTLVDCLCNWVTSLVGRFVRCPIVWMRFVQHLLAAKPPSVGWHNGDKRAGKHVNLRRKIVCLLCDWISPGDGLSPYCDWFTPRLGGIITLLTLLHSCKLVAKHFSVASLWELVSLVSVAL